MQGLNPVLHRPECVQEVLVDLQIPPLDLSPQVSPRLHVVLGKEAGELFQCIHSIFIIFKPRIKNLRSELEIDGAQAIKDKPF